MDIHQIQGEVAAGYACQIHMGVVADHGDGLYLVQMEVVDENVYQIQLGVAEVVADVDSEDPSPEALIHATTVTGAGDRSFLG